MALDLDERLVAAASGDRVAFADVYDGLSATVFNTARRVLGDAAMAEEVAQEVFLELWSLAPRFEPTQSPARAWVITITRRRAIDRVRREVAWRARNARAAESTRAGEPEAGGLDDAVVDGRQRSDLMRALQALPLHQRQALVLVYFGELSHRQAAESVGVPLGTMKSRVRDGMRRMRSSMLA